VQVGEVGVCEISLTLFLPSLYIILSLVLGLRNCVVMCATLSYTCVIEVDFTAFGAQLFLLLFHNLISRGAVIVVRPLSSYTTTVSYEPNALNTTPS
jgi:hypothetical protein